MNVQIQTYLSPLNSAISSSKLRLIKPVNSDIQVIKVQELNFKN